MTVIFILSLLLFLSSKESNAATDVHNNRYCIHNVDVTNNRIVYDDKVNNSVRSQQLRSLISLDKNALYIIVNITYLDDGWLVYLATRYRILQVFSPQLFDELSLETLSAQDRVNYVEVELLTTKYCEDSDINKRHILETLMTAKGFNCLEEISSINGSNDRNYYLNAISKSGIMIFLPNALFSIFTVFIILIPCLIANISSDRLNWLYLRTNGPKRKNKQSSNQSKNSQEKREIFLNGIYVVMICFTVIYIGYLIIDSYSYFSVKTPDNNIQQPIDPFITNILFLSITALISFVGATCNSGKILYKHNMRLNKSRCSTTYKMFIVIAFSCSTLLLTCLIYHTLFLIIALTIDWKTTLYQITYLSSYILMALVSLPTIFMQFTITLRKRAYIFLFLIYGFLTSIPCLYYMSISGCQELTSTNFNISKLSDLVPILFFSFFACSCTIAVAVLVFRQKISKFKQNANTNEVSTKGHQTIPKVEIKKQPKATFADTSSQRLNLVKIDDSPKGVNQSLSIIVVNNPGPILTRQGENCNV